MVFVNVMVIPHANEPPRSFSSKSISKNIILTFHKMHGIFRSHHKHPGIRNLLPGQHRLASRYPVSDSQDLSQLFGIINYLLHIAETYSPTEKRSPVCRKPSR